MDVPKKSSLSQIQVFVELVIDAQYIQICIKHLTCLQLYKVFEK